MRRLRPRLTFANVVSVIALFIALGGASYAAFKLPKNSVGRKQLKKNAVTTAKIKNSAVTGTKVKNGSLTGANVADGSLTGAQINASTLGEVPAASRAGNATTLDGSPAGDFARSNRFLSGNGKVNATTSANLFSIPGEFVLKTNGLGKFEPKLLVQDLSPDPWDFLGKQHENTWESVAVNPGESREVDFGTVEAGTLFAVDRPHPEKQVLIDCTYEFNTSEVICTAILSPSA
jgi:hypothetical protein